MLKMLQYPQTKICPKGQNVSVPHVVYYFGACLIKTSAKLFSRVEYSCQLCALSLFPLFGMLSEVLGI